MAMASTGTVWNQRPDNPMVKTYRYLRIAMVVLVACLFASVVYEWHATGNGWECMQKSISAYYYTPAQAIFVATLFAIGACMVALKGNTETEDLLLNIAGSLAPVVALVPTPNKGTCMSILFPGGERSANVANNMTALFAIGMLALVITVVG